MFSSVKAGLTATAARSTHIAISPADLPFLSKESLRTVLSAVASLDAGGSSLVVPSHDGRRGHPLLIPAALRARLLSWPDSARLNQLFEEPDVTVHHLEGFDETILRDVDRPEDLVEGLRGSRSPSL
ncbi:MAG: NTP transferase domain-containing protein [Thermoanaerobaculia bacterium]|nr:NTP transferase domain-containing protein [Thermoanaerobaculia bacterium]